MYIKQVEITNFKSFGGTTRVPLLPGFTVVSGPNGSGKSNILDALLFALGLSSSKGMRADRLPDLVNQGQMGKGQGKGKRSTVEAAVTVTFDLSEEAALLATVSAEAAEDLPGLRDADGQPLSEWTVTRKLRVTQQGTYTSNYYIGGEPCTLSELHQSLSKLRIYPEGYNVVLQGDVTSIISMNPRERRQIVDELAGVANFDRKIIQTKQTLEEVKEREDRCRILEQELQIQCDRLAKDRTKALKYQQIRQEMQGQQGRLAVVDWLLEQSKVEQLRQSIAQREQDLAQLADRLVVERATVETQAAELERLNQMVKSLGESEQIALQTELATHRAQRDQVQRQQTELTHQQQTQQQTIARLTAEVAEVDCTEAALAATGPELQERLEELQQAHDRAAANLNRARAEAAELAEASQAWVQQQTDLRHQLETIQASIDPQRTERATLQERLKQIETQLAEIATEWERAGDRLNEHDREFQTVDRQTRSLEPQIQTAAEQLAAAEQELQLQQKTRSRLQDEQRQVQRQLDKLEAQTQAQREAQGTFGVQLLLQSDLPGICGLVANLGQVEPPYQVALEIAAGARLGHLVVEDDAVAAAAIEILKRERAGRVTFLPLNKIRGGGGGESAAMARGRAAVAGWLDYAVNLVDFDDRYRNIFEYVFGGTVVFERLDQARSLLGRHRIVTLDGELLETSGAMTGGSMQKSRGGLRFGGGELTEEAKAAAELRDRLRDIDRVLGRCDGAIAQAQLDSQRHTQTLNDLRQARRDAQRQLEQLQAALTATTGQRDRLAQQRDRLTQELTTSRERLAQLDRALPAAERQLANLRQAIAQLEDSPAHSQWSEAQTEIRDRESVLSQLADNLRSAQAQHADQAREVDRLSQQRQQLAQQIAQATDQLTTAGDRLQQLQQTQTELDQAIANLQGQIAALETTLGETKQQRDRQETVLNRQRQALQTLEFQRDRLQETQQQQQAELQELENRAEGDRPDLPPDSEPLPSDPAELAAHREQLDQTIRTLQRRLESLEPVNMLALEEYDQVQGRLNQLSEKLATIEQERTELLLRVENFTTLRQQAFYEAFDAVDRNFQIIFAELSQGDGRLQLDDPENPLESGLNLVAHPKGKPVQRLASMSGGEKSLTALSFIFALQRYRPSPFYAFDEVDMFLDGSNVERLAKMVKQQAAEAQFIVVSLRRPTIEASDRVIGVTQARGAQTQVLGVVL
ncbi:chromosome segregation protein SMC [Limnothrix sp. FACHB-881]|uniref:chromosome segregation protein SMC n=1 Tax=Limnothrix sp. FACHB-881 TaxID=2692819 RepID=UPI0016821332|nr:chromosome segregation protein SMC [Limnothrix sp. FACHB-881]MBD2636357.1 chromosome segregation protein SMC [Limnothrix sp. FACHB-881]